MPAPWANPDGPLAVATFRAMRTFRSSRSPLLATPAPTTLAAPFEEEARAVLSLITVLLTTDGASCPNVCSAPTRVVVVDPPQVGVQLANVVEVGERVRLEVILVRDQDEGTEGHVRSFPFGTAYGRRQLRNVSAMLSPALANP